VGSSTWSSNMGSWGRGYDNARRQFNRRPDFRGEGLSGDGAQTWNFHLLNCCRAIEKTHLVGRAFPVHLVRAHVDEPLDPEHLRTTRISQFPRSPLAPRAQRTLAR
jgi:hypothetical protein